MVTTARIVKISQVALSFSMLLVTVGMLLPILANVLLGLSAYIAVPAAFILITVFLICYFEWLGKRWQAWLYMKVDDVYELKQAAHLTGLKGYPIDKMITKYPNLFGEVAERFNTYTFIDDLSVPQETVLEKKVFLFGREPYLTLNTEGIRAGDRIISWGDVNEPEIWKTESSFYISYEAFGNRDIITLDRVIVKPLLLNHLVHVYRHRHITHREAGR